MKDPKTPIFIIAICSLVLFASFRFSLTAKAENAMSNHSQTGQTATVKIAAVENSWIHVTVDEKLVFIGRLRPPSIREWSGESFTIKTDNRAGVQLRIDGTPAEFTVSNDSDTSMIFSWPDTSVQEEGSAEDSMENTVAEEPLDEDSASDVALSDANADMESTEGVGASEATSTTVSIEGAEAVPESTETDDETVETITYLIKPGDSLSSIGERFGVEMSTLVQLNGITNVDIISVGSTLTVPIARDADGTALAEDEIPDPRGTVTERLTLHSQADQRVSPYYKTTWLTYYGRPNVPVMGILGEYNIDQLTPLLEAQAEAYDAANGPDLDITSAFHLVYGMATKAQGRDGSHLTFLGEETTMAYIERAAEEEFEVILDVQVGALSPAEAMALAFPMLEYDNVHLGLDPEFAMSHPNQFIPGSPPGFVTAQQVNEAQAAMQTYMEENDIKGVRVLLLHQFLASMIVDKENLDYSYDKIALTISVDGWGPPDGKVVKYNGFVDETAKYSAFKLFYGWDRPLMSERQAMGVDSVNNGAYFMETTPNLIIYQ